MMPDELTTTLRENETLSSALAAEKARAEEAEKRLAEVRKLLDDALSRERKGLVPLVAERDTARASLASAVALLCDAAGYTLSHLLREALRDLREPERGHLGIQLALKADEIDALLSTDAKEARS